MGTTPHLITSAQQSVTFQIDSASQLVGLYGQDIQVDVTGDILLLFSFDGSTFDNGIDHYAARVDGAWQPSRTSLPVFMNAMGQGNAPSNAHGFDVLIAAGDGNVRPSIMGRGYGYHSGDSQVLQHHTGYRKAVDRVQAIKLVSPGNFVNGSLYLIEQ